MGANKLHTMIIVIGGNYTYTITMYIKNIYIYTMFLVGFRALKKKIIIIIINNINRKRKKYFGIINPVSAFLSQGTLLYSFQKC